MRTIREVLLSAAIAGLATAGSVLISGFLWLAYTVYGERQVPELALGDLDELELERERRALIERLQRHDPDVPDPNHRNL